MLPINSDIIFLWYQGGRNVSSATFQRSRKRTKSILAVPSKPEGAATRLMDNRRMKEIIKFDNFNLIYDGLKKTIDWYISTKK